MHYWTNPIVYQLKRPSRDAAMSRVVRIKLILRLRRSMRQDNRCNLRMKASVCVRARLSHHWTIMNNRVQLHVRQVYTIDFTSINNVQMRR